MKESEIDPIYSDDPEELQLRYFIRRRLPREITLEDLIQVFGGSGRRFVLSFGPPARSGIETNIQSLDERVHKIEDWQEDVESRLEDVSFKVNITPLKDKIDRVENYITKTFSDISYIKHISYSPITDGLGVMIVHESDDKVEALNQIEKRLSTLEEAFPDIYFEPWVLHISEINAEHLKNMKTVMQK